MHRAWSRRPWWDGVPRVVYRGVYTGGIPSYISWVVYTRVHLSYPRWYIPGYTSLLPYTTGYTLPYTTGYISLTHGCIKGIPLIPGCIMGIPLIPPGVHRVLLSHLRVYIGAPLTPQGVQWAILPYNRVYNGPFSHTTGWSIRTVVYLRVVYTHRCVPPGADRPAQALG